jgi:hypothetical protein
LIDENLLDEFVKKVREVKDKTSENYALKWGTIIEESAKENLMRNS